MKIHSRNDLMIQSKMGETSYGEVPRLRLSRLAYVRSR